MLGGGYIGEVYIGQYRYLTTETAPADIPGTRATWMQKAVSRQSWAQLATNTKRSIFRQATKYRR